MMRRTSFWIVATRHHHQEPVEAVHGGVKFGNWTGLYRWVEELAVVMRPLVCVGVRVLPETMHPLQMGVNS